MKGEVRVNSQKWEPWSTISFSWPSIKYWPHKWYVAQCFFLFFPPVLCLFIAGGQIKIHESSTEYLDVAPLLWLKLLVIRKESQTSWAGRALLSPASVMEPTGKLDHGNHYLCLTECNPTLIFISCHLDPSAAFPLCERKADCLA